MRLKRLAIGFVIVSMMAVCLSLVFGATAHDQKDEQTKNSSFEIKVTDNN
jgi:hypothetical protein